MRTDLTVVGKLGIYVAALAVVFVTGYALGDLTGVGPTAPPVQDEMSEMPATDH